MEMHNTNQLAGEGEVSPAHLPGAGNEGDHDCPPLKLITIILRINEALGVKEACTPKEQNQYSSQHERVWSLRTLRFIHRGRFGSS